MIGHIVRKDWKLVWHYALLFAALQFVYVVFLWMNPQELQYGGGSSAAIIRLLEVIAPLSGILLIAAIAHQDALPGFRQDWLVRPIGRRYLLLAKLLSLLLMVHLPIFLADLLYGFLNGFPAGVSIGLAVSRGVFILLAVSIPILAFSSITKSLLEAIAIALIVALSFVMFNMVIGSMEWDPWSNFALDEAGIRWVPQAAGYLVGFVGAIAILVLQYYRRNTGAARALTAFFWLLFLVVSTAFPWSTAFAIEQRLAKQPGAGSAVTMAFTPEAGKRAAGTGLHADHAIFIPVRIDGIPADTVLRIDRLSTRTIFPWGADHATVDEPFSIDGDMQFHENGTGYLHVSPAPVPRSNPMLHVRNQAQPVQFDLELSMTLLRVAGSYEMSSLDGPIPFSGKRCHYQDFGQSRREEDPEAEVYRACMPILGSPPCFTLTLPSLPPDFESRPVLKCVRDYRPFPLRFRSGGEALNVFTYVRGATETLTFQDVVERKALLHWYEPVDHFTRKIVIPEFRLREWIN